MTSNHLPQPPNPRQQRIMVYNLHDAQHQKLLDIDKPRGFLKPKPEVFQPLWN
jgi:hypothetical protein